MISTVLIFCSIPMGYVCTHEYISENIPHRWKSLNKGNSGDEDSECFRIGRTFNEHHDVALVPSPVACFGNCELGCAERLDASKRDHAEYTHPPTCRTAKAAISAYAVETLEVASFCTFASKAFAVTKAVGYA